MSNLSKFEFSYFCKTNDNAEIDNGKMKWYCIIDESGEDYLYPPMLFEIVEE